MNPTTQAARDAWFVGFTSEYVAGVWMGYDDNTPLTGVTGGGLPAEIFRETMVRVHDGLTPQALPMRAPTPPVAQVTEPPKKKKKQRKKVGEAVDDVLRSIFGGSDNR